MVGENNEGFSFFQRRTRSRALLNSQVGGGWKIIIAEGLKNA